MPRAITFATVFGHHPVEPPQQAGAAGDHERAVAPHRVDDQVGEPRRRDRLPALAVR